MVYTYTVYISGALLEHLWNPWDTLEHFWDTLEPMGHLWNLWDTIEHLWDPLYSNYQLFFIIWFLSIAYASAKKNETYLCPSCLVVGELMT